MHFTDYFFIATVHSTAMQEWKCKFSFLGSHFVSFLHCHAIIFYVHMWESAPENAENPGIRNDKCTCAIPKNVCVCVSECVGKQNWRTPGFFLTLILVCLLALCLERGKRIIRALTFIALLRQRPMTCFPLPNIGMKRPNVLLRSIRKDVVRVMYIDAFYLNIEEKKEFKLFFSFKETYRKK